jgi:hypothetical protein
MNMVIKAALVAANVVAVYIATKEWRKLGKEAS